MFDISTLLLQGVSTLWIFIPTAILLGALHGLEPGHSKTMMAAFIVAIGGTVTQAILLGVAATISHTAVVWVVAMLGIYAGNQWSTASLEPYLQLFSALIIMGIAGWMIFITWRQHSSCLHTHEHHDTQQDPHAEAHARDIKKNFSHRKVTHTQIMLFGLTGGLIPCPAAISVLLLCLQLKKIVLGAALVLCFSLGLALTLVLSGVLAALSLRHATKRWSNFSHLAQKAPYFSGALLAGIGFYMGLQALQTLGF
jgi:nickel/cobalt transporter (NicO) family protein